eukprot:SAG22_NODE_258_length_13522_cov_6.989496_13_plen_241_part_00
MYTDASQRTSGIVTFCSFRAVNTALQLIHTGSYKDFQLHVSRAPEPGDMIWRNMALTWRQRQVRKLWSNVMSIGLTVFWAIPVIVITALTSIDALAKDLPTLQPLLLETPGLSKFVQGTLPAMILSGLMAVLPIFLRLLAVYEGGISSAGVQRLVVQKYFFFLIFNVVVVSAIAGSLLSSLTELLQVRQTDRQTDRQTVSPIHPMIDWRRRYDNRRADRAAPLISWPCLPSLCLAARTPV